MLRTMRRGRDTLHQRLEAKSALSVSAKGGEMGSSRVCNSCTVSITASKGLAAGHRIKSQTRFTALLEKVTFFATEPYVTISFFQLHTEHLKVDDGTYLPCKDLHFLLHKEARTRWPITIFSGYLIQRQQDDKITMDKDLFAPFCA